MTNKITGLGGLPQSNLFHDVPDFTRVVHERENTLENQTHLDANRYHFTGQAAVVYSVLKKGAVLSSRIGQIQFNMSDIRRRIKELKDSGVEIQECFEVSADGKRTRYKLFYIYDRLTPATRVKYKIPHPNKK